MVLDFFHQYDNQVVFLERSDAVYNPKGRNQTAEEAKEIDERILAMLSYHKIPFKKFRAHSQVHEEIFLDLFGADIGRDAVQLEIILEAAEQAIAIDLQGGRVGEIAGEIPIGSGDPSLP
jgi:hypothetical protein